MRGGFAVVSLVLCLQACAIIPPTDTVAPWAPATTAASPPSTSTPPRSAEDGFTAAGDVPAALDPELLDGILTTVDSRTEFARHIFASWPQFGLPLVDEAVSTHYSATIRDFERDYPDPQPVTAPELNLGWSVLAASPSVVGFASDGYEFGGASGARSWRSFWFDPRSGALYSAADLLDRNAARTALATAALTRSGVDLTQAGADPLGAAPLLAFSPSGDLLVGFDQCGVAACADGRISLTIPRGQADTLLTATGRAAREASIHPSAPAAAPSTSPTPAGSTTPATPDPSTTSPKPPAKVNCRRVKCIALTFDDGPGPYTQKLLGYLRGAGVHATFFMLGSQVEAYPKVASAVAAAGNEIGVHTWDHRDLTRLTPSQIDREIGSTVRIIRKDTGVSPRLLRPPYGAMNARVHTAARRAGLALALWDVDTLDWRTRSTTKTVAAAVRGAHRGSIILVHDIHPTTVAAVPAIIRKLGAKGYTFVTVSQLLGRTKPGQKYFRG
jgi:peptidoglycan/xylan/chitin deacetylase (PgdA/CDA1 family)